MYLLNRYALNAYNVPGIILGAGNSCEQNIQKSSPFFNLFSSVKGQCGETNEKEKYLECQMLINIKENKKAGKM